MSINTVITQGIVIEGEIRSEESLTVEGSLKGRVSVSDALTVGPSAHVEADIESDSVVVQGAVTGNVTAKDKVEIQADGRMVGDVKTARIAIADGASFKGNIDMDV